MSSNSMIKFNENCKDIEKLLELHRNIAGDKRGRKWGVEVLNKSVIVLMCAYWEAYNEDICKEAIDFIIKKLKDPKKLPKDLKKSIAKKMIEKSNPLEIWEMAGEGWKKILADNVSELIDSQTLSFHTPKADKIKRLFYNAIGIEDITQVWRRPRLSIERVKNEVDYFVSLRGDIAHKGRSKFTIMKYQCKNFLELTKWIVKKVDEFIYHYLKSVTDEPFYIKIPDI